MQIRPTLCYRNLQVMDPPSPDGSRLLSITAFVLNIVLLYGFGVASFLIPKVNF